MNETPTRLSFCIRLCLAFCATAAAGTAEAAFFSSVRTPSVREQIRRADPAKKTVCFATINSSDEKETFESRLSDVLFNKIELARPAKEDPDWFGTACKSGVKCDALVISGHFGGTFFGASGLRLPLSTLELHSCAKDCEGLLAHPREVYLFGCNTLAGREKDSRTPAEYVEVLVRDGFSRLEAEAIAEARYGTFGQDNESRMRRVFEGVPYLYGFSSIGPAGKNVRPLISRYLERIGDYFKRLEDIFSDSHANAVEKPNAIWSDALKVTTRSQCRGLDRNDPAYAMHAKMCELLDSTRPLDGRLASVGTMLRSPEALTLLPTIQAFFDQNSLSIRRDYEAELRKITDDAALRDRFLKIFRAIHTPVLRIDWMRFALSLGWIGRAEFVRDYETLIVNTLNGPITNAGGDALCSITYSQDVLAASGSLDYDRIASAWRPEHFRGMNGVQMLFCSGGMKSRIGREMAARRLRDWRTMSDDDTAFALVLFSFDKTHFPSNDPTLKTAYALARQICAVKAQRLKYNACISAYAGVAWTSEEAFLDSLRILREAKGSADEHREGLWAIMGFDVPTPKAELAKIALLAQMPPADSMNFLFALANARIRTDAGALALLDWYAKFSSARKPGDAQTSSIYPSTLLPGIDWSKMKPETVRRLADFVWSDPKQPPYYAGFTGLQLRLDAGLDPGPGVDAIGQYGSTGYQLDSPEYETMIRLLHDPRVIPVAAKSQGFAFQIANTFRNLRISSAAKVPTAFSVFREWKTPTEALALGAADTLGIGDPTEAEGALDYLESAGPLSLKVKSTLEYRMKMGVVLTPDKLKRVQALVRPNATPSPSNK